MEAGVGHDASAAAQERGALTSPRRSNGVLPNNSISDTAPPGRGRAAIINSAGYDPFGAVGAALGVTGFSVSAVETS